MVYMPESDRNIKEYKGIFKSTFLFGFVQVARMLVGIIKNKFVAIYRKMRQVRIRLNKCFFKFN